MADGKNPTQEPQGSWQFKPGDTANKETSPPPAEPEVVSAGGAEPVPVVATAVPPKGPEGSITWTASEFIAHQKSPGWYVGLALIAVTFAAVVWFLTKDMVSTAVVIVGALLLGIYGARKPRQLEYRLDGQGLSIGSKHHTYQEFRSFSIVPEGAFNSIVLMPLKRFSPLISLYYDPVDEPKIAALLSEQLPVESRQKDLVDRLMWRIRF